MTSWVLGNLGDPDRAAMRFAIVREAALAAFGTFPPRGRDDPAQVFDARLEVLRRWHRCVQDAPPQQPPRRTYPSIGLCVRLIPKIADRMYEA